VCLFACSAGKPANRCRTRFHCVSCSNTINPSFPSPFPPRFILIQLGFLPKKQQYCNNSRKFQEDSVLMSVDGFPYPEENTSTSLSAIGEKRMRKRCPIPCWECRKAHKKCDGDRPCSRWYVFHPKLLGEELQLHFSISPKSSPKFCFSSLPSFYFFNGMGTLSPHVQAFCLHTCQKV
jgi:hypothetical protein